MTREFISVVGKLILAERVACLPTWEDSDLVQGL